MKIGFRLIDLARQTNVLRDFNAISAEIRKGEQYLLALQEKKLSRLLKSLKSKNPYYQKLLNRVPDELLNKEPYNILSTLPYLEKKEIRQNFDNIFTPGISAYVQKFTGGSTGNPLTYYIDKKSVSRNLAFLYYFWSTHGYHFGDKHIVVGGGSLSALAKKWQAGIYYFLQCRYFLEGDYLTPATLSKNLNIILSGKHKVIYGYPSTLEQYVNYALKDGKKTKNQFKRIFTTSELLNEKTRTKLENYFNCNVIDMYGANDGGVVASECSFCDGFHYNMQDCIVEEFYNKELDKNELVLTNLNSISFPFVRYKVGDIGTITKEACRCGSPLPRIKELKGRTRDIIKTKKGILIHGCLFNQLFKQFEDIERYQIIQEGNFDIEIYLKTKSKMSRKSIERLKKQVDNIISDRTINVKITFPENFKQRAESKFRMVISNVA